MTKIGDAQSAQSVDWMDIMIGELEALSDGYRIDENAYVMDAITARHPEPIHLTMDRALVGSDTKLDARHANRKLVDLRENVTALVGALRDICDRVDQDFVETDLSPDSGPGINDTISLRREFLRFERMMTTTLAKDQRAYQAPRASVRSA
jgi:hypothetical protein